MGIGEAGNDGEYYGATREAQDQLNELLGFPATGREQDWEIEFADPARIEEMLEIARGEELNLECRSALWLLILASLESAFDEAKFESPLIRTAAEDLARDSAVLDRMRFHWIKLGRSSYPEKLSVVLSVN